MEITNRDKELQKKYPEILKYLGGDPAKTCMSSHHGGISVGDGWIPLLEKLFTFCQFHHDRNGYPQLVADQIKEKFGTLRFYYLFEECTSDTAKYGKQFQRTEDMLKGAIYFAESLSSTICEGCGAPGTINKTGWLTTRCSDCRAKK